MGSLELVAQLPAWRWSYGPAELRDVSQAAEAIGYDCLFVSDHVTFAYPRAERAAGAYAGAIAQHEALTVLAAVSAWTTRVRLQTGVLVLPQRQPLLVAKQAAEVDVLSGGRLRLGVGLGWSAAEFAALGASFGDRAARFEEGLSLLRACWSEEPVSFAGRFTQLETMSVLPKPVTPGGPPLLIGAFASVALDRAARLGDGWIAGPGLAPEGAAAAARAMRERVEGAGRDAAAFAMQSTVALEADPGAMGEALAAYRAAGFDRLGVHMPEEPVSAEDYIRRLEVVQRDVWPLVVGGG